MEHSSLKSQKTKKIYYIFQKKFSSHFRMTADQVVKQKNLPYSRIPAD